MTKNFLLLLSFETGCSLFYPPLSSSLHQIRFLPSVPVLPWTFLWKNPACKPHTSCSPIFSPLPAASTQGLLLRAVSFSQPGPHAHWLPRYTKDPVKTGIPGQFSSTNVIIACVPAGPDVRHSPEGSDGSARLTEPRLLIPTLQK